MDIKILSPEDVEFKEKDVQSAFEGNLSALEEGLEFVASEVVIGAGRIDTLAFDSTTNRPVFIEYKRKGEFDKDALIQLMDYLSWFARDENRFASLEKIIRNHKPVAAIDPSIRLICVVGSISDRLRNAIYAIANHVKIVSYLVARDTANKVVLLPKLEVDNSEIEIPIRAAASEQQLLQSSEHLKDLFVAVRPLLEHDGATSYTTSKAFRFKKDRIFAKLRFRKKYIQLELKVGAGHVADPDFTYWRQGKSNWGYTYLYPSQPIPSKVIGWIDAARDFSSESSLQNGDDVDDDAD